MEKNETKKWDGNTESNSPYCRLRRAGLSHDDAVAKIEAGGDGKKEELKSIFKVGSKYTLYKISEASAMTCKTEIKVKEIQDDGMSVVFTKPRGRKLFVVKLESRHYQSAPLLPFVGAIFDGWDQPIKVDSETGNIMRGNACYNFVGIPLEIKVWIETGQLNPFFKLGNVLAIAPPNNSSDCVRTVVFPDAVEPGRHAVIDAILMEAAAKTN